MHNFFLAIVCVFAFASCKKEVKDSQDSVSVIQVVGSSPIHPIFIDSISGKEGEEIKLLQKTVVNNLIVTDNHVCFALTREKFLETGLPEYYYDQLMEDMKNINNMIDSTGLKNLDKILEESYKDLYEIFGNPNINRD